MTFLRIIILGLSLFSLSAFSAPSAIDHMHGDRSHSHVLPGGLIGHQHGQGEKGRAKQSDIAKPAIPGKKTTPSMSLQRVQSLIRSSMKDPQAARFGKWWIGEGLPGENAPQWCGFVNGKNSYGAYTGNRLFISMVDVDSQFSYWIDGACKPLK